VSTTRDGSRSATVPRQRGSSSSWRQLAGQAAVYSRDGRECHVLVRSEEPRREHVAPYLIRRIEETPTSHHTRRKSSHSMQIVLEHVQWPPAHRRDGGSRTSAVSSDDRRQSQHGLAKRCIALEEHGFIRPGRAVGEDLPPGALAAGPRAGFSSREFQASWHRRCPLRQRNASPQRRRRIESAVSFVHQVPRSRARWRDAASYLPSYSRPLASARFERRISITTGTSRALPGPSRASMWDIDLRDFLYL